MLHHLIAVLRETRRMEKWERERERDVSSNDVQLVCNALQLNRSNEANGGNINTCKHTHTYTEKNEKSAKSLKSCSGIQRT